MYSLPNSLFFFLSFFLSFNYVHSGGFFLSNVLMMIPAGLGMTHFYDSFNDIGSVITRILTVVTMILTITLNVFFFMVKTCDKTATKKTFLGTLYEATQQNVMGLDLLIGFAVIGVIYIKYTGKSARDFGF